jgi:hypothetical protein
VRCDTSWTLEFGEQQQIVTIAQRSPFGRLIHISSLIYLMVDHVASLGRVLGDRSVLYKYLNPYLVAITTYQKSPNTLDRGQLSIHLLDTVSGRIVYTMEHENIKVSANEKVCIVISENWVVYSYWGWVSRIRDKDDVLLPLISVLEMYESDVPDQRIERQVN